MCFQISRNLFLQLPKQLLTQKDFKKWNQKVLDCLSNSIDKDSGPVHINLPFEEPLYDTEKEKYKLADRKAILTAPNNFLLSFGTTGKTQSISKKP